MTIKPLRPRLHREPGALPLYHDCSASIHYRLPFPRGFFSLYMSPAYHNGHTFFRGHDVYSAQLQLLFLSLLQHGISVYSIDSHYRHDRQQHAYKPELEVLGWVLGPASENREGVMFFPGSDTRKSGGANRWLSWMKGNSEQHKRL